jgi:hypothetical protein
LFAFKPRLDYRIEVVALDILPFQRKRPCARKEFRCRLLRLLPFSRSNLPLLSSEVIGSHGAEETPPPGS